MIKTRRPYLRTRWQKFLISPTGARNLNEEGEKVVHTKYIFHFFSRKAQTINHLMI
jgi:hypothetical protein